MNENSPAPSTSILPRLALSARAEKWSELRAAVGDNTADCFNSLAYMTANRQRFTEAQIKDAKTVALFREYGLQASSCYCGAGSGEQRAGAALVQQALALWRENYHLTPQFIETSEDFLWSFQTFIGNELLALKRSRDENTSKPVPAPSLFSKLLSFFRG